MKVRLKKDAPWESVISPDGQTIDKINWLDEKTDIRPFAKFIDYTLDSEDVAYDLQIGELVSIAENNFMCANNMSKEEIIKKLKENNIKMPKKEIIKKLDNTKIPKKDIVTKVDLSTLSKAELVSLAESKSINVKGLSKSKLIEVIENV